jgi:hypothetical protein
MARTSKEYQAFTSLMDRLLTVSKDELDRRMVAYKTEADKRVRPGRKRKATQPSASRDSGGRGRS